MAEHHSVSLHKTTVLMVYISVLHSAFIRPVITGLKVIVSYVLLRLISTWSCKIIIIYVILLNYIGKLWTSSVISVTKSKYWTRLHPPLPLLSVRLVSSTVMLSKCFCLLPFVTSTPYYRRTQSPIVQPKVQIQDRLYCSMHAGDRERNVLDKSIDFPR